MTWYLYALVDPVRPRRIRYVGVTKAPDRRQLEHRTLRVAVANPQLRAWKFALADLGRAPFLVLLASFETEAGAKEREWRTILRWRRRGQCDLNAELFASHRFRRLCDDRQARSARCLQGATQVQPNLLGTRNGSGKEPLMARGVA